MPGRLGMIVVLAEANPHTDEWLDAMRERLVERASVARETRLLAAHGSGPDGEDEVPHVIQPGEGGPDLAIHRPSRRRPNWDFSDSATIVPPYAGGWANPDGSGDVTEQVQQHG